MASEAKGRGFESRLVHQKYSHLASFSLSGFFRFVPRATLGFHTLRAVAVTALALPIRAARRL